MATRSRIGKVNEDGSVTSIYCHWDGYTVGSVLLEHYNTPEAIDQLLSLGSLSSIGSKIIPDSENNFSSAEDVCIPYTLRGEEKLIDKTISVSRFKFELGNSGEQIGYLFQNNKWYSIRPKRKY